VIDHILAKAGSSGTGTFLPLNDGAQRLNRLAVEVNVTTGGGTTTYTVEGLLPDGVTWVTLALAQADSTVAVSNAAVAIAGVGTATRYIAGLEYRFFRGLRINVSANTNAAFNAKAYGLPD
jgi:hypothetical protein